MLDKNILKLIIPLILVVTISGVPIEDTSNEPKGTGTIAVKVPPEEKDGPPRPMLLVYSVDKTTTVAPTAMIQNAMALEVPPVEKGGKPRPMLIVYPNEKPTNTTAAPLTSSTPKTNDTVVVPTKDKENDTLKVPPVEKNGTTRPILFIYSVGKPNSTTDARTTTTTESTVPKDSTTRPVLIIYSVGQPNSTTDTPTTTTTESTVPKDSTTRPMLIIYSVGKPNSTTDTPTTTTTESTVPKDSTPQPMLVLYSVGKPNSTTDTPTTTTTESTVPKDSTPRPMLVLYSIHNTTTTADPSTSTTAPSSYDIPKKYDTPRPIMWINSDVSPSSNETAKRLENVLRGYNCPMRKGFFQYPGKCDVYIECKDYVPLTYICPEGLQFNPNAKNHEHVCDEPSVVKCKTGEQAAKESEKDSTYRPILFINSFPTTKEEYNLFATTEHPKQTTGVPSNVLRGYTCPKRRGFFRYPGKCDAYIMCEDYAPLTYICPDGLYFNPNARRPEHVCDDPSVVKCEYRDTRPSEVRPVTRPTPGPARQPWSNMRDFSCPSPYGYFKLSEQCDEYVECRAFTPTRFICPDGLHFKSDALWAENPCVHPWLARCALY